ncbi:hypothetical protein DIPPA_23899 [Diplonema papillatum]|nr:hypothetical protein DIPPA_23899 [Diplonema papillatum]
MRQGALLALSLSALLAASDAEASACEGHEELVQTHSRLKDELRQALVEAEKLQRKHKTWSKPGLAMPEWHGRAEAAALVCVVCALSFAFEWCRTPAVLTLEQHFRHFVDKLDTSCMRRGSFQLVESVAVGVFLFFVTALISHDLATDTSSYFTHVFVVLFGQVLVDTAYLFFVVAALSPFFIRAATQLWSGWRTLRTGYASPYDYLKRLAAPEIAEGSALDQLFDTSLEVRDAVRAGNAQGLLLRNLALPRHPRAPRIRQQESRECDRPVG